MEYRKFYLTKGQIPPEGSTGIEMPSGGIVWIGEDGTFPSEATGDTTINFDKTYINHKMSQEEIDEYNEFLDYQKLPDGADVFISFDQFRDPVAYAARKEELKQIISTL